MRDLVARGEHLFQQPEFIEETRKRERALVDLGKHLFQQAEFIEETSKQERDCNSCLGYRKSGGKAHTD